MFSFRKWSAKIMYDWRTGFADLDGRWARFKAYFDLYWVDHGFLRAIYGNTYEIAPGVFRRSQPSPRDIRAFAAKGGKTIINLRGEGRGGPYVLEREACAAAGARMIDVRTSSRRLPAREIILQLADLFDHAERPLLMHCKSGADRAGLAAGLYRLLNGGTLAQAKAELSWRYLHFSASPTGVLDQLFVAYAAFFASQPMPFRDWVETRYDPEAIAAQFEANRWGVVFVDWILRRE